MLDVIIFSNNFQCIRFQILTASVTQAAVFWIRIHLNLIQPPWIWRQQFPPKRNDAEKCYWNVKYVMCERENKCL